MDENEHEIATVATTALLTVSLARSRRKKRRKRKVWVKPWIASRETNGAFHKLMKDLEKDVDSLNNYLRMDLPAFEELLGIKLCFKSSPDIFTGGLPFVHSFKLWTVCFIKTFVVWP